MPKKGNNKFEEYVKNIMVEAKFKSDVEVKISDQIELDAGLWAS